MHIVSISGPPESGKTTLWTQLNETLPASVHFVPDIPRQAIEVLDPRLAVWSDPAFQHYVGFAQLLREHLRGREPVRVLDKSLIDAQAYWRVLHGGPAPLWASALSPRRYDVVLLCDHRDIPALGQGSQRVHQGEREQLAGEIERAAPEYSARVVRLVGDRDTRLAAALAAIQSIEGA